MSYIRPTGDCCEVLESEIIRHGHGEDDDDGDDCGAGTSRPADALMVGALLSGDK